MDHEQKSLPALHRSSVQYFEENALSVEPADAPNRRAGHFSQAPNILDVLGEDCWRYLLSFVPVEDIVRSERVSRQWQAMVHIYLKDIRFSIQTISNIWDVGNERQRKCIIKADKDDFHCFNKVINKWGPSAVELIYDGKDSDDSGLWNLGLECRNLENVTFVRLPVTYAHDWVANFTKLRRISFENCMMLDRCIGELLKNNTVEELVLRMTEFTGSFLGACGDGLKNIKTLVLSRCPHITSVDLLCAVDHMPEITKLELRDLSDKLHQNAHLVLERLPRLEHLALDSRVRNDEVVGAVTALSRLRYLGWYNGAVFHADDLAAVRENASRLPRGDPIGAAAPESVAERQRARAARCRIIERMRAAAQHRFVVRNEQNQNTRNKTIVLRIGGATCNIVYT